TRMTTTLAEQRDSLIAQATAIAQAAKEAARDLTADEQATIAGLLDQVKAVDGQMDAAEKSTELLSSLAGLSATTHPDTDAQPATDAKSLGDHFIKSDAYREMKDRKSVTRFTAGTREFQMKADPPQMLSTGLGQIQYG